jgi:ASC-1-like (ASCH) protein
MARDFEEELKRGFMKNIIMENEELEEALEITPTTFEKYKEISRDEYLEMLKKPARDCDKDFSSVKKIKKSLSKAGLKGGYLTTLWKGVKTYGTFDEDTKKVLVDYFNSVCESLETMYNTADAIRAVLEPDFKYFKDEKGNPRAVLKSVIAELEEYSKVKEKKAENNEIFI